MTITRTKFTHFSSAFYEDDKLVAAAGTDWAGTVSETGTSSVVERGSNVNGEYVKFADGTLICTIQQNTGSRITFGSGTSANPYRSDVFGWTFPVAFASAPTITATGAIISASAAARANSVGFAELYTTNVVGIQSVMFSSDATVVDVVLHVTATGRWY